MSNWLFRFHGRYSWREALRQAQGDSPTLPSSVNLTQVNCHPEPVEGLSREATRASQQHRQTFPRAALLLPYLLSTYLTASPIGENRERPGEPVTTRYVPVRRDTLLPNVPERFGFGKPATPAQIARLDNDVRPDGVGLPAGSGTAKQGAVLFATKCAACHGAGGVGGPNGSLVTTAPAPGKRAEKTIGTYWPYATTVFDYIRRAMPFNQPGSLTNEEVYALTAYLLTANGLISEKTVLTAEKLPRVIMPAQPRFVPDDRRPGPAIH